MLDTYALLWFCEGNVALSVPARAAMEEAMNERFVRHATAWEVAIKLSLGKLTLQGSYDDLFPGVLLANGFARLPPDFSHYRALLQLPLHHCEPFDRMLIAQAKVEGLTLVTCDGNMPSYGGSLLWQSKSHPSMRVDRACGHAAKWRDRERCVISGFHSPVEKECLRILLRGKQPIILCPVHGLNRKTLQRHGAFPRRRSKTPPIAGAAAARPSIPPCPVDADGSRAANFADGMERQFSG